MLKKFAKLSTFGSKMYKGAGGREREGGEWRGGKEEGCKHWSQIGMEGMGNLGNLRSHDQ